jgi:hypothetical protein
MKRIKPRKLKLINCKFYENTSEINKMYREAKRNTMKKIMGIVIIVLFIIGAFYWILCLC